MKQMKCPGCGAPAKIDNESQLNKCPYCGSILVDEKNADVEENDRNEVKREEVTTNIPPKPMFNAAVFIILLCLYFWPGVIYAIIKSSQISEWEKKYGKNKKT